MKFKTVTNDEYMVDVDSSSTFNNIAVSLQEIIGEENLNISFMARGKIINNNQTVEQEGLDNNSTLIIVIRKKANTDSSDESVHSPTTITLNINNGSYERTYTGSETKHFLTNPTIMLNIIHMIGGQNPFFLSYLAVNPSLAHQYLYQTFNNPDFKLIVKCDNEDTDPLSIMKLD